MIALPPGCTVNYAIFIDIEKLTDEMIDWYQQIGGTVHEDRFWNNYNKEMVKKSVRYGKGKLCHYRQDGTGGVRLHFHGDDASVATMFIIKFLDYVQVTNLEEHMYRKENQY